MQRTRLALAAFVLVLVVAFAGCGGGNDDTPSTSAQIPPSDGPPIRIGAKNFTEQAILGELYRQALEAKGYDVVLKPAVGSTEIIHRALQRGALDMYPEYVGVLLSEVADLRARPRSAAAAYELARAFEKKRHFTMLAQTPLSDSNALGVKPQFAKRHRLRTIADLRRLPGTVKISALSEFATRYEGLVGLHDVYGLRHLRVTVVPSEGRYPALDHGDVDVASVFKADGQLAANRYVVLDDPRGLFASGHVAPIISDKALAAHEPGLRTAIDAVSRVLTTPAMREMNAAVDLTKRKPAVVAREFLASHGLN
jgi:osmoprotectant transport system substrate-binding protein